MNINKTAIATFLISLAVVCLAAVYFIVALPILNGVLGFLDNEYEDNNTSGVLINADDILDFGSLGGSNDDPASSDATMPPAVPMTPGGSSGEVTSIKGKDVRFRAGTKTVLLLGYNDGLADSIFLVNIDEENKTMKMVSIPRDTYVYYSTKVADIMKNAGYFNALGAYKLNASTYVGSTLLRYNEGKFGNSGIDFMCSVIDGLLPNGCQIDQYVYVEFEGFMDIIDAVGGVDVTVSENMYNNNGELVLAKGKQHINSKEALFYVRYRTRLDENGNSLGTGGDNYRKKNQLGFLVEVSSQIITKENMKLDKITATLDALKKSVFHSFDLSEIMEYIEIGMDFSAGQYTIEPYVIIGDEMSLEELEALSGRGFDHSSYVTIR